mgnify:CR=1 FL=1
MARKSTPRRAAIGFGLDIAGQIGLPVAVGMAFGYWVGDRGTPWLPTMLQGVLALLILSALAVILGKHLQGDLQRHTDKGVTLRKRVLALIVVVALGGVARLGVFFAEQPSRLTSLPPDDLASAFVIDSAQYREHDRGMERILQRLERSVLSTKTDAALTADDEALLLDAWAAMLDYGYAQDAIRIFWEDWYRFDPGRAGRPNLLRSFLLSFAAELSVYEKSARLTHLIQNNANARKFLDTPHPEAGLPGDTYSHWRQETQGTRDQARVVAGGQYLHWLERIARRKPEVQAMGLSWLWTATEDHIDQVEAMGLIDRSVLTVMGDVQVLHRGVRRVWLPTQTGVANLMGDTKLRRVGWYLIDREQQEALDRELEPGDVLLSRKNWYLSNVGLPGFWGHAILYVGDAEKLAAWADDPEVDALVAERAGEPMSLPQYLAREHGALWLKYQVGAPVDDPYRVIEAIGEGVVPSTFGHAIGDSLAALRPTLGKRRKAEAILDAFAQVGKPYDFDFDFATEHALVCTELVWRAYRPVGDGEGLTFPLEKIAGRRTLPANVIAREFDASMERGDPQLDFVLFYDGDEKARRAVRSDLDAFRASHTRQKWL